MKILPQSGSEWFALYLAAVQILASTGYMMAAIQREPAGVRTNMGPFTPYVFSGYVATFAILLVGAIVQRDIGPRGWFLWTCVFGSGVFMFGYLLLPYVA